MNKHQEMAQILRDDTSIHYNCNQAIIIPYAEELGLSKEQAFNLGFNFGGGMKCGSVCGAITAGLMVLGMKGINDVSVLNEYYNAIKKNHDDFMECRDLLKSSTAKGIVKKTHCDSMIAECIGLVDELIEKNSK